jgi:hypothetical protein
LRKEDKEHYRKLLNPEEDATEEQFPTKDIRK